jgi:hypothetical protein
VTAVAKGLVVGISAPAEDALATAVDGLAVGAPDLDHSSQEKRTVDGGGYATDLCVNI